MASVTNIHHIPHTRKTELSALRKMIDDGKSAPVVSLVNLEGLAANYLLSLNQNNRPLRTGNLERLVGAINRGEWRLNGASIVVSQGGILLDGQHRLTAIAKTNVVCPAVLLTGAPDESFKTIDQGRKRTLSDLLGINGPSGDQTYAAAIRLLYMWYKYPNTFNSTTRGVDISSDMLIDFADKCGDISESIAIGRYCKKAIGGTISASVYAACHYEARETDEDQAKEFFDLLISGANLAQNSPILVLRNTLARVERCGAASERRYVIALVAKAWNAWREGNGVKALRFTSSEDMPEFV